MDESVVLVQKNKPEKLKGLLNFPGGKIENDESELAACIREFEEETGEKTSPDSWNKKAVLQGVDWEVHVFTHATKSFFKISPTEKHDLNEKVGW